MQTAAIRWTKEAGWDFPALSFEPQLILYFGATALLADGAKPVRELVKRFPAAVVCGCSTAGEIIGRHVFDDSVVAALVHFSSTKIFAVAESTASHADSRSAGRSAAQKLPAAGLRHVLILSDGISVNGTALVEGIRAVLAPEVAITGGLAGDGSRFQKTYVGLGENVADGQVVLVGFYGPDIRIGYGSRGGWEGFGPRRGITRSEGNTLFELDGQPALALYKRYLGPRAAGLPATGLLFPLWLTRGVASPDGLVRTILAVDEAKQSLTFAGDMPQGWYAQLMKATPEQLVDGSGRAAREARLETSAPALSLLVSCVGRRLVLGARAEDEIETALGMFPPATTNIGFYSYGEACPTAGSLVSELHNQTMTVTFLSEV